MNKANDIKFQAVKGFIKMFSCSHSMLMASSQYLNVEVSEDLLKAATGFGAGISAMGDICGMVNGGAVAIGQKLSALHAAPDEKWKVALLCNALYHRIRESAGMCSCGEVHGGKYLAKNFRRAILTGKTLKCFEMLSKGAGILDDLIMDDHDGLEKSCIDQGKADRIREIYKYFQDQGFHCCGSTIKRIQEMSGKDLSALNAAGSGFIGGIGFSGTFCGSLIGGIMAISLAYGIDPRDIQYKDTAKIIYHGLVKNDKIWTDEKVFKPAKVFNYSQQLYKSVEKDYGNCDCRAISGLDIEKPASIEAYKSVNRIRNCKELSESIARQVAEWL